MRGLRVVFILFVMAVSIYSTSVHGWSSEAEDVAILEIPEDCHILGAALNSNASSDPYLEAYLQGVLDTKYPDSGCLVTVRNGEILLSQLPASRHRAEEMVSFVQHLTKRSVQDTTIVSKKSRTTEKETPQLGWHGVWLPQSTILYPTQVANPRQIMFSVGGRFDDNVGGNFASNVTFGDQFPVYRWANLWGGDLQLEIEGGVFAVFDLSDRLFPLINADYYGGIPLTFAKGNWAHRLRIYHVSSHLGDEYMQANKKCKRKNKSFEAIDVSTDYQVNKNLRVYGVLGAIVSSDSEMSMKPLYLEYGCEARGFRTDFKQLFGQTFFAVHIRNYQDVGYALDTTCAFGYEWGKVHGIGRKIRLFAEYHHGFSPEGQFSRERTNYFGLRVAYGF